MIKYPSYWQKLGVPITLNDIDRAIREVITEIDCINLSFSGGVDSCLLLYYILETKGQVRTFTVANDKNHPDIEYSCKALRYFENAYGVNIGHTTFIMSNLEGDELVRAYYTALTPLVQDIITGDCIDELACGYYEHQDGKEETYQNYLRRLQSRHLEPLNANSGDIRVYMPYADDRIANLFHRIPLYDKVTPTCRKVVMIHLAEGKVSPEVIERRKYGLGTSVIKEAAL